MRGCGRASPLRQQRFCASIAHLISSWCPSWSVYFIRIFTVPFPNSGKYPVLILELVAATATPKKRDIINRLHAGSFSFLAIILNDLL